LWILFGLQLLSLIFLVIGFAWFEPRLSNTASKIQSNDAKFPSLRQQISDEQSPEILRKDALTLLDGTSSQSNYVQKMIMTPVKVLGIFCILSFVSTTWLGLCLFYKLRRRN
jgi:septal ring-binding cell division protein DamX